MGKCYQIRIKEGGCIKQQASSTKLQAPSLTDGEG
jgi:hypothetical protein